jgi:hypothetical protein
MLQTRRPLGLIAALLGILGLGAAIDPNGLAFPEPRARNRSGRSNPMRHAVQHWSPQQWSLSSGGKPLSARARHRQQVASTKAKSPAPKCLKVKARKHHPVIKPRDATGMTSTPVGRNPDGTRRVWLGGISAQRGY